MKGINKQFKMTFLILVIVLGSILLWNLIRGALIQRAIEQNQPSITVSTAKAQSENWRPSLYGVGTLTAINGVMVSTQAAGNIVTLNFASGARVKQGDLLVQIDDRTEQAELQNDLAALKLAEITYLRNKELLQRGAVSNQVFDEATAKYQQAGALVAQVQATIAYKHITAPFDGVTGIRNVNLGQYVKPGDTIVALQALDPLYVNFFLPEKYLHEIYVGQEVNVTVDSPPKHKVRGKVTALDSLVDVQTHNIMVQATIPNPDQKLYPGLFARINVLLPAHQKVVTVPQTAINYSLYGDSIYVVEQQGKDKNDQPVLIASLREVKTGEEYNNRIIIKRGLKVGEEVVTSGQLKLSNGQRIHINNSITP